MGWIIGGIITWALALTPVLILRYVVLKRPIGKWPAVGLGALTSLVHVVVFALLGVTKLGPVSAVVGFVAYWILHGEYGGKQKKQRADGGAGVVEPPVTSVAGLYNEGCRLSDAGEHAAAVDVFTKCTGTDPSHADAWHNRGYSLVELGRLSEAIDSFSQALALQPEDSATLFARGLAREALGEYAGAAADFEHYLSGSGALDQEKIAYAQKAIDSASKRLASGAASGQTPVEAARADDTEDARRLLLSDPNVWLRKGLALAERREWRDAVTCLGKVLALKPNDPDALFGLAQAEDALGAADSAREHFGQFLIYTSSDDRSRIDEAQRRLRDVSGRGATS